MLSAGHAAAWFVRRDEYRMPDFEDDIRQCVATLRKGGLILYPTDTIWGIGCDATRADAVRRVYELKRRADNRAMLALVDSVERLEGYVEDVPEVAYQLIEVADKPLTIVYDGAVGIADNLLGPGRSVGIRVTCEEFSRALCRRFGRPIVSTSANISGGPSAATFGQISREIVEGVDYVVRYRQDDTTPGSASSVVQLRGDGTIKILRS